MPVGVPSQPVTLQKDSRTMVLGYSCTCVTHRADSVNWMSSSSLSSRVRASRTVSPGSNFLPGSSHQPDQGLSPVRTASKSQLLERMTSPAAMSTNDLDVAG